MAASVFCPLLRPLPKHLGSSRLLVGILPAGHARLVAYMLHSATALLQLEHSS